VSTPPNASTLGIIAGSGDLPRRLITACRNNGRPCFVLAFEGQTDRETVTDVPHRWSRLGAAQDALDALHQAGVVEIVLAGRMKRPSLSNLAPDVKGAAMIARIGLRAFGDDSLLRAVKTELEREGFRIVGPDSILESLLAGSGPFGRHVPSDAALADIARGIAVARALGAVDVGQAVVVQQGIVLGVEAVEGTDALLARAQGLKRDGVGGVLVKLAKPGQDRGMDLPTIGPTTVRLAHEAGLVGIAVEAGGTLVVDRAELVSLADQLGLFVIGLADPAGGAA
jgi:DUF1009 family protein